MNQELKSLAQTLLILLRGTPIVLYGDELGLKSKFENNKLVQPYMEWDNTANCGFSSVNKSIVSKGCTSSVLLNTAHGAGDTDYDLFTNLVKLRLKESFLFGKLRILNETNVFSFMRTADGFTPYLVIAHFNAKSKTQHLINFNALHEIPLHATIEYYYSIKSYNKDFTKGKKITTDRILMSYGEIVILALSDSDESEKAQSEKSSSLH